MSSKVGGFLTSFLVVAVAFLLLQSGHIFARVNRNCESLSTMRALLPGVELGDLRCSLSDPAPLLAALRAEQKNNDHSCEIALRLAETSRDQHDIFYHFHLAALLDRCGYDSLAQEQRRQIGADRYFMTVGRAAARQGDYADAEEAFSKAIQIFGDEPDHWLERASVRLEQGDFEGALHDSERALELNPNLEEAYITAGVAMRRAGDLDVAEDWFLRAFARFRESPTPSLYLANLYLFGKNDLTLAERYVLAGLSVDPDHVSLNRLAARVFYRRGERDRAIAYLEKAIAPWQEAEPDRLTGEQQSAFANSLITLAEWYSSADQTDVAWRYACSASVLTYSSEIRERAQVIIEEYGEACP